MIPPNKCGYYTVYLIEYNRNIYVMQNYLCTFIAECFLRYFEKELYKDVESHPVGVDRIHLSFSYVLNHVMSRLLGRCVP